MRTTLVPVSTMIISDDPDEILVTTPLSTCLAVAVHDPGLGLGGVVHCLLPHASLLPGDRARENPAMFVNTGVAMLVRRLRERGADPDRLVFKAAGGSRMETESLHMTGENNRLALTRILALNRARLSGQALGGRGPRTMRFCPGTGTVCVTGPDGERDI